MTINIIIIAKIGSARQHMNLLHTHVHVIAYPNPCGKHTRVS